jgi:CHRD domain
MARLAPLPSRRHGAVAFLAALAAAAALLLAGTAYAATLPPDFPADVPLAPGQLQSATGGAEHWSVLLLVDGPAGPAHASTVAFYRAHGFVADTDSVLHDATHQVTIAVEARDHSPGRTFVAIGVGPRAPSSGRIALAARLTGHGRGRAAVTFTGARACWTIRGLRGVGRPTTATIRQGAAGRSGPVIVRLGRGFRASGCTTVTPALGQAIAARAAGFYVSVATRAHPGGAVRGQLRRT